jgi:hypothetical protein
MSTAGSTTRGSRPHMRPTELRVVARLPVTYTSRTLGLGMKPETARYYTGSNIAHGQLAAVRYTYASDSFARDYC